MSREEVPSCELMLNRPSFNSDTVALIKTRLVFGQLYLSFSSDETTSVS